MNIPIRVHIIMIKEGRLDDRPEVMKDSDFLNAIISQSVHETITEREAEEREGCGAVRNAVE